MTSFGGLLRRLFPPPEPTGGAAILMYHRIAEESFDPWGLAVSPGNFAGQLEWLAANRSVMRLAEFAKLHREGNLPDDAVAITFDDGYASVIEEAATVLERFGAPATVFIPAESVERGDEFWWDELEQIVLRHPDTSLDFDGPIELGEQVESDGCWEPGSGPKTPRQRAFLAIWERLKALPPEPLSAAMNGLRGQASRRPSRRLLSPDELRSRPALLDVGSHALTHASLPALSRTEKTREIRDSVARCEAISGTRPTTFAYPFGDIDRTSLNLVRDAGFECACTTQHSFVHRRTDPFSMPRLAVPNCDAAGLASLLGHP